MPESAMDDHVSIVKQAGINEKLRFYLGLLDGVPVGTCCLYADGEIGGLYWVGTLPEARGRKIATAMVLYTLERAISMGCTASILQASEMGEGVYLKIGFREYCQIDIYMNKG
jgi:GNAT superfamily N-acetyltransferase